MQTRNRLTALILLFGVALSGVALAVTSMAMSKNEKLLLWSVLHLSPHQSQPALLVGEVRYCYAVHIHMLLATYAYVALQCYLYSRACGVRSLSAMLTELANVILI